MVKVQANDTNPDGGGNSIRVDCDCHLACEKVEITRYNHKGVENLSVKCDFFVLAASVASEGGKKISEFFPVSGKAAGKFLNLAVAAGLTTKEAWKQAQEAGQELEIDENLLVGRQICAAVRMEEYQGSKEEYKNKKFATIGFRTHHPRSEEVKNWIKDEEHLALVPAIGQTEAPAAGKDVASMW